ncbi:Butyrophilin-like protein 2 [Liparis tanakae]|uniref:Butyrophilin-like protein 2 n=1 Tax=Liparis tanakae TaxID=230148 RepID=A0A4Z2F0Z3_9TELE|nr:Butyrophilin-like protein 2 [Liparis tanakae]
MSCRMLPLLFIPLLFILPSCVCGPFVVNVTQSSYQAEENHNVTLEWTFTTDPERPSEYPDVYCVLLTSDKTINLFKVYNGVQNKTFQDEHFSGRVQWDQDVLRGGRVRLHVSRLRTSDSGQYLCEVSTSYGMNSGKCQLNVSGAVSEPKLSVVPGVPVTVQCDAGCWSPLPEVTIEDARGNAVAGAQESKHVEDSVRRCVSVTRRATVKTDRFGYS